MLRGYWGYIAVAAIALTATVVWLATANVLEELRQSEAERERAAHAQADYSQTEEQCADLEFWPAVECLFEASAPDRQQQHDRADLRAQQEVAAWTRGLYWIGVAGFVVGIGGLGFLAMNFTQLQEQSRLTRELFVAENRPWLKVRLSLSEASVAASHEPGFFLNIEIENIGKSPAYSVYVEKPRRLYDQRDNPAQILRSIMSSYRRGDAYPGFSMLPGDKEQDVALMKLTRTPGSASPAQSRHLLGWVAYRLTPEGEIHFTPISQSVFWLASEGESVEVENVRLSPSTLGIGPD